MRIVISILSLLLLLIGCDKDNTAASSPPAVPPIQLEVPAEFSAWQRSTVPVPGSNDKLLLTIGDVTGGQVITSLAWEDGQTVLADRSLRQDDKATFTLEGHDYTLELIELSNSLLGNDSAKFKVSAAKHQSVATVSEDEMIKKLIQSLHQLKGADFIRNGQSHTVDEAIEHMRNKWQWKKSEIETAEDFIRIAGSKSSTTGKPYVIQKADGTEITTKEWFQTQLEKLEQ